MQKSRLLLLFLTLFFVMLGVGIIIPSFAYYTQNTGATLTEYAVLMSVYSAMQLVFTPIWGRLSDKYGRKPAILTGLLGNAASLIAFGLASDYVLLLFIRSFGGVAAAAVLPTVMAYVADVTTDEERGKGMGLMGAAIGLGITLGPAIGGILGRQDLPFFVAGGLSILNSLLVFIILPESLQRETLIQKHSTSTQQHEWVTLKSIFEWKTLTSPLTAIFLVSFFSSFSFMGFETVFPHFIKDKWSYGQKEMGGMFLVMGAVVVLFQGGLLGRMINTFGERRIILSGILLHALGIALLPTATPYFTLTLYLISIGIGSQIVRPTNASWFTKLSRTGQGTVIGVMDAFSSLGRILGPLLAIWFHQINIAYPYFVLAGCLIISTLCLYLPLCRIERNT